jgi:hypothetical protein
MKRILPAMVAALLMVALASSTALATPKTTWKVYTFNASGQAYSSKTATTFNTGIGFNFLSTPDTALLTTADKSLTGDLTGKTLTATFEITGTSDAAFTYYGAPGQCGLNGPFVRLYFTGTGEKAPGFYSNYWWSNPASTALAVNGGTLSLSVPLTTGWSDWNGQPVSAVPANFAAAVASVSSVGLSFGGGCFFANGVGVTAGSASFILMGYTVS